MAARTMAETCQVMAQSGTETLAWIGDPRNAKVVGPDRASVERKLRSQIYRLERLERVSASRLSVGVFGPSQAGKSYLVSVLARKGDTLNCRFNDKSRPVIDFVKDINPYGETEATGLVTRFTTERQSSPDGFPVILRLLTQPDLIKIFLDAYYFSVDLQDETLVSPPDIEAHLERFGRRIGNGKRDVLREEDIWEIEDYVQRAVRKSEITVFKPYWPRFAEIAPMLSMADRAELFSIFWGGHAPLTDLFRRLLESLSELGFAETAYCTLDALLPSADGILNVATLQGMLDQGRKSLVVKAGDRQATLNQALVAALVAELRLEIDEQPWPFLDHTDILDFPGYRGRAQHKLERFLKESPGDALKELFLRGKVEYLFRRYSAEQELTSILLCIGPKNMEAHTLPIVIEEWVGFTHGRTPDERRGRPVQLYFIFTMFDSLLSEKAGDTDPAQRFIARLQASLLLPFAKVPSAWPLQWTPGETFRNCFWIRNPNFKAEGVFEYDGLRELRVRPEKVERIGELREVSAGVAEVAKHFDNPREAFDAAMRLNDGGVSYLAAHLTEACKPGMKERQMTVRLNAVRDAIVGAVEAFYIPTDAAQRLSEKIAAAERVIEDFSDCVHRLEFGRFLYAIKIDRRRLDAALTRLGSGGESQPSEVESAPVDDRSAKPERRSLLAAVRTSGPRADSAAPIRSAPRQTSRSVDLARAAFAEWVRQMEERAATPDLAGDLNLSQATLRDVARELIAAAKRTGQEQKIVGWIDQIAHIGTQEQRTASAAMIAEFVLNHFTSTLGYTEDMPVNYDATGIGNEPVDFYFDRTLTWLRHYDEVVKRNADSADGLIADPEQNRRLGEILAGISAL